MSCERSPSASISPLLPSTACTMDPAHGSDWARSTFYSLISPSLLPTLPGQPGTEVSEHASLTSNEAERFLQAVGSAAHWLHTHTPHQELFTHTHTPHTPRVVLALPVSLLGALKT